MGKIKMFQIDARALKAVSAQWTAAIKLWVYMWPLICKHNSEWQFSMRAGIKNCNILIKLDNMWQRF